MLKAAVLVNIRSLHNVGSIFRTADASGVEKLYLCGITPAPADRFGRPRPQLAKVSLGAEKHVAWEQARSAVSVIKKLKKEGYKIFALEQSRRAVRYDSVRAPKGQAAVVVGNEVRGLPPNILKLADKILEIPMRGKMIRHAHHPKNLKNHPELGRRKESLNVAVAFGVVVYAINK